MAAAKIALLFCASSAANVAVSFLLLQRIQAKQNIDTRNWGKLRAQPPKPFEEYGMVLRIQNGARIRNCALDY